MPSQRHLALEPGRDENDRKRSTAVSRRIVDFLQGNVSSPYVSLDEGRRSQSA